MAKSRKRNFAETAIVIGGVFVAFKFLQNRNLLPTASGTASGITDFLEQLKNSTSNATGAESGLETGQPQGQRPEDDTPLLTEDEVNFNNPGPNAGGTGGGFDFNGLKQSFFNFSPDIQQQSGLTGFNFFTTPSSSAKESFQRKNLARSSATAAGFDLTLGSPLAGRLTTPIHTITTPLNELSPGFRASIEQSQLRRLGLRGSFN